MPPPSERPEAHQRLRFPLVTGIAFLVLRGVLLWVVIPLAFVLWVIVRLSGGDRSDLSLRTVVGWADLNLCAALSRSLLRPMVIRPLEWTPWRDVESVSHRVSPLDPY